MNDTKLPIFVWFCDMHVFIYFLFCCTACLILLPRRIDFRVVYNGTLKLKWGRLYINISSSFYFRYQSWEALCALTAAKLSMCQDQVLYSVVGTWR